MLFILFGTTEYTPHSLHRFRGRPRRDDDLSYQLPPYLLTMSHRGYVYERVSRVELAFIFGIDSSIACPVLAVASPRLIFLLRDFRHEAQEYVAGENMGLCWGCT